MTDLIHSAEIFMTGHFKMSEGMASFLSSSIAIAAIIFIGLGCNWILQGLFRRLLNHNKKITRSPWHPFLARRRLAQNILLLIPGLIMYVLPNFIFERGSTFIRLLHRIDLVFITIVVIMIINSALMVFLDIYSTTAKNKSHPLQGVIQGVQVILIFIGAIISVAILIDKSPKVLLAGLGASAAVLMLVFKDSILGFVAGVQLSQNNMIRLGDWIQLPDGSANGTVEEITLNTVKVRNWDNTISTIPPYTLVTTTFKNWRGMQESGGRRADKCIYIDMNTLEVCSQDMISDIRKAIPVIDKWFNSQEHINPAEIEATNVQLYRLYIELYLRSRSDVNQELDIIVTQKEATAYGLPIEVYFFTRDKVWAVYERKQSDIFDHLMSMVSEFGLRLYQRP